MPSSFYHLYEKLKNSSGGASGTSSAPSKSTPVSVTTPLGIYSKPGLVLPSVTVPTNPVNAIATPLGVYTNSMLYPVAGIRSTPSSTSGIGIDTSNPKQINSIYDALSYTWQTLGATIQRSKYTRLMQNPIDAYYIRKYGLENYFKNYGIDTFNWNKTGQAWKTVWNDQIAQPFKMLKDETIPFKTKLSNLGSHLLLNFLPSFGETTDIYANIVKAALPTKITRWEEKYPELSGWTPAQRIIAGIYGKGGVTDPISHVWTNADFKYYFFERGDMNKVDAWYKNIADTIKKDSTLRYPTFDRYTFEWDIDLDNDPNKTNVGEVIINTVGEFFSDPLNCLEIGGAIADAVGGNKAVLKAITKNGDDIYNSVAPELIKNGTLKWDLSTAKWFQNLLDEGKINKNTFDAFQRIGLNIAEEGDDLFVKSSLKDLFLNTKPKKGIFKRLASITSKGALRDALYGTNRAEFIDAFTTYIGSQNFSENVLRDLYSNKEAVKLLGGRFYDVLSEALVHKTNFRILGSIHSIAEGADTLDSAIIKLAGMPVMTPVVTLLKTFGGKFIKYIGSSTIRSFEKHMLTKDGVDLGIDLAQDYETMLALAKQHIDALKLANADITIDSAEAAEKMMAEMAARSLNAQVAYFNSVLSSIIKKYPADLTSESEVEFRIFVNEVLDLCKMFISKSKDATDIGEITDVHDFAKYFDQLMIKHPELQMYVSPNSIHALERIGEFEDMIKTSERIPEVAEFNKLLEDLDIPVDSKGDMDILELFYDTHKSIGSELFKEAPKSGHSSQLLYDSFYKLGKEDALYDGKAAKHTTFTLGDDPKIRKALGLSEIIDETPIPVTEENIEFIKDFKTNTKRLRNALNNFNYDKIDKGLREAYYHTLDVSPKNTKQVLLSKDIIKGHFNKLRRSYNKICSICNKIDVDILDKDTSKIPLIKDAYGRLYSATQEFLKEYNEITTKYNTLTKAINRSRKNIVEQTELFTFTKATHLSQQAVLERISALFLSGSQPFMKQPGVSEKLYSKTLAEIKQIKSIGITETVIPTINDFFRRSDLFSAELETLLGDRTFKELTDQHGTLTNILKKYFKTNKNIDIEHLTFEQFKGLVNDTFDWLCKIEEDFDNSKGAFNSTVKSFKYEAKLNDPSVTLKTELKNLGDPRETMISLEHALRDPRSFLERISRFANAHPAFVETFNKSITEYYGSDFDLVQINKYLDDLNEYDISVKKKTGVPFTKYSEETVQNLVLAAYTGLEETLSKYNLEPNYAPETKWDRFVQERWLQSADVPLESNWEQFINETDVSKLVTPMNPDGATVIDNPNIDAAKFQEAIREFKNSIRQTNKLFSTDLPFYSDLGTDQSWVMLRRERLSELLYTLSNPLMSELRGALQGNTSIGNLFNVLKGSELEQSLPNLSQALNEADQLLKTTDFIENILTEAEIKLPPEVCQSFFETLMNYAQDDLTNLLDSGYQYRFYQNMCLNMDSKYSPRRASLDAFRTSKYITDESIPSDVRARILRHGHTDPGSDTLALKYKVLLDEDAKSIKDLAETYLKNNKGRKVKFFDIETVYDSNVDVMTVNKHGGRVVQISLTDYVSETGIPDTKVYRLSLDSKGRVINYDPTMDSEYYESPMHLFYAFNKDLEDTDMLIGMNSTQFDVPFLKEQWAAENSVAYRTSNFYRILYDKDLQAKGGGHYDVYHAIQLANKTIPEAIDSEAQDIVYKLLAKIADGVSNNKIQNNFTYSFKLLDSYEVVRVASELKQSVQMILGDKSTIDALRLGPDGVQLLSEWALGCTTQISSFKNGLLPISFKDMLCRDLTKETVTRSKIEELVRYAGIETDQDAIERMYRLLSREAHLSAPEMEFLLKEGIDADPIIQAKLKDAWVRRMYYFGSGTKESYVEWLKKFNMSDTRNLQHILMDDRKNLFINYRKMYTEHGFDILLNSKGDKVSFVNPDLLNELFISAPPDTLDSLRNVIKKINDLTNYRIKQPEAILHLGIFKNIDGLETLDELKKQTVDFIELMRKWSNPHHWSRYVDLNTYAKIGTVEHWFALWYAAVTDGHTRTLPIVKDYFEEVHKVVPKYIDEATLYGLHIKDTEIEQIKALEIAIQRYVDENVFDKISKTVLDNKGLLILEDDALDFAHPLYDLFEENFWQAYTGVQRLDKASRAIDFIGKGGAKEYARAALLQNMRKVITDINNLPKAKRIAYAEDFAKQINDITGILNTNFLLGSLDKNFEIGANYILSDLLYRNGVRILHLDPELPDTDFSKLCKELLKRKEAYEKFGVQIDYDEITSKIYLRVAKGNVSTDSITGKISYNGKTLEPLNPAVIKIHASENISKEHADLYTSIMTKNQDLFKGNYLGRSLNQENFKVWIEDNLPKELKYAETSIKLEDLSTYNFYRGTNLRMCEVYDPASTVTLNHIAYSQTVHNFFKNYRHMLNTETGQDLFFDFMLSPTYGMGFKNTEGIFKGLSEKEILKIVNSTDEFVPIGVVKDNSIQGFHVVRLQLNTVKDVRRAGELNAVLVPYQVYSSCFDEINNTLETAFRAPTTKRGKDILKNQGTIAYIKTKPLYYARMGLWMYKVGSLIYPGTWVRNLIDSNLKAMIDTGDPIGTIRNNFRSMDMMHRYNETIKQFIQLYGLDNPRTPGPAMLKDAYKKFAENGITPKMGQDEFLFLHNFIINGPSTGETKVLRDWFTSASDLAKQEGSGFLSRFANTMLTPMNWVETNARLGQYLTLMEQGVTKTEAFTRISKTAFDYNIKSNVDKFVEYFIPFFNFQKLNAMYWAEVFYKHPMAIKFLNDFTKNSWETFEYDDEYYMSEKAKIYHMLNGNLMIDPASGFVLKLNPSYMDALNWLYDPVNSVIDSLLAPFQNYVNGLMDNDAERFVQKQIEDGTYIIRVGKYKGFTVNEVLEKDPGYLQFALDKDWFRMYDRSAYISAMLKLTGTPMSITFGDKFNGQPVSVLLEDKNRAYAQYLMTQQWFKDLYKPVYDYLVLNKVYEDPVMPWGKFEGKKISEVPKWYFDYIMQNDWMYESYGYLADAIIENRNTILPMSEIDFDSKATLADASGKIAAGIFIEDNEQANIYLKSILDMFNQASTYPVIGPFIQKYITSIFKDEQGVTPYNSSARTNDTRLLKRNAPNEAMLGALFPDIFGSVTLYERYKQEEAIDYSKASPHVSKYRPQDYNDRRNRHHNYYRSGRAERYRTYHKHVKPSLDVAQLRLGIAQLHLGV